MKLAFCIILVPSGEWLVSALKSVTGCRPVNSFSDPCTCSSFRLGCIGVPGLPLHPGLLTVLNSMVLVLW